MGKIIVTVEGPPNSGKTAVAGLLASILGSAGVRWKITGEPPVCSDLMPRVNSAKSCGLKVEIRTALTPEPRR